MRFWLASLNTHKDMMKHLRKFVSILIIVIKYDVLINLPSYSRAKVKNLLLIN